MMNKTVSEKKSRILMVEDSPIQAEMLRRFIEQQGLSPVVAVDGKEALALVEQEPPELIVSDIAMPVMDGFELCHAIKESGRWRHIPVIMLTHLDEPTDILKGLVAGADSYVVKPYDEEDLLTKINTFLHQPATEALEQGVPLLEFEYEGEIYSLRASQEKILHFLITTYENAIRQNHSLLETQVSLREAKDALAQKLLELQDSEERYRSTVQLVPDIIYRTDDKGYFTFLNNAVQSLGYTPEELLGHHFSVLMLPADADSMNRNQVLPRYAGQQTGDEGSPSLFDERRTGARSTKGLEVKLLCKKGGSERWGLVVSMPKKKTFVEVHSAGLYGSDTAEDMEHRFLGSVGAIRDITKRKYAEEALQSAYAGLEDKVRERTAELAASNEALMQSKYELSLKSKISEIFLTIPGDEMYAEVLHTVILKVMNSTYGNFGYIDEKGDLVVPSMTRDIWEQCNVPDKDIVFPQESWGGATWARSLTDKKTVFSNQPSTKVPEGHIPMSRHVFVPIIFQDEAIGQFGVANKETDYQQTDIQLLESISLHIAPMLSARLLREREERELKLAEEKLHSVNIELNQSNENLEKIVAERTAEIQESRRLGTALKKSEEKFQDLYNNAPDMFVSVDVKTSTIIECNQTLTRILGYSKEELIGKPIFIVYHPDCLPEVKKVFQSFVQTGEVHNAFLQLKRKDDSTIDVILNVTSVRDEQGNIIHSRSSWRDISDLKKTEAALSRSEEQTRLLLDSTAEAIYGVDLDGECTFVNRACLEILGYDDESIMLGNNMHELIHHKHSDGSGYPLEECRIFGSFRKGERSHADDEVFWRADGTSFPVEFWAYPIIEKEKIVGSVVTFIDISKRKKVAEELARHKDHLEVIVEKRTAELQSKMDELELFNQLAIGREEKMIQLKEEINELSRLLGRVEKYKIVK